MSNRKDRWGWLAMALLALVSLTGVAPAQWGGSALAPKVIELEVSAEPASARRGAAVTLSIKATIDPLYHIYALDPLNEGPIATSIALDEESGKLLQPIAPWKEPKPTVKFDRGFQVDIASHYGAPVFTGEYRIAADAPVGEHTLKGYFTFMACKETNCLPPNDKEFTVTLTVEDGEPLAAPAPTEATANFGGSTAEPPAPIVDESLEAALERKSFMGFLGYAFGLGLLALLTPCVFPMIPITVSFFSNKASKSTVQAAYFAGVYVLSIILGFALIGFGISLILRAMGAGVEGSGFAQTVAANPWINLGFAALYIVLALGLFEVIHFALPQGWANKLNMRASKRADIVGIALKAVVFVVISFTCTAPLLGLLIVRAIEGQWLYPFFGMMAFSAGFSAPFFFLALAPQMLSSLPKAGDWMYAVKITMGLLVIAAAMKFVSNADLVWRGENMILTRELLLAIWAALAGVTALYLFGMIRLANEDGRVGLGRLGIGTCFAASALYLAAGLFGQKLNVKIEAYLPPDMAPQEVAYGGGGGGTALPAARTATGGNKISSGFSWYDEYADAVSQAEKLGAPIFVDFTGWSCTNCREMEKLMFPNPRVAKLLESYVRVKLYTDDPVREKRQERQAIQARLFNTIALPTYGLVAPDGTVIASEQYTTDVDRFVRFLERGLTDRNLAAAR